MIPEKYIITAEYEEQPARIVQIASSEDEADELATDWLERQMEQGHEPPWCMRLHVDSDTGDGWVFLREI